MKACFDLPSGTSSVVVLAGLLFCVPFLSGCQVEQPMNRVGSYAMVVPEVAQEAIKGMNVALVIKRDGSAVFCGQQGLIQQTEGRTRIVFKGEASQIFSTTKKGIRSPESVYFWLEFTDAGNCVLYDTNAASFFLKKSADEDYFELKRAT